jgi:REP element-mobilizing transposase RayT
LPGGFYHTTLRGNHQQAIFRNDTDRLRLNEIVARALGTYGARLHAYCWMTNHLHFLIQIGDEPLGTVMRQIASDYARAFQRAIPTTGHLFERRYHARIVGAEPYLLALLRYVHLNPVAAGIVKFAHEYRWSSFHGYAGRRSEAWLTTGFLLAMFSNNRAEAIAAFLSFMDCDTAAENEVGRTPAVPLDADFTSKWQAPARGTRKHQLRAPQSLDALIEEACRRFETTVQQLHGESRDPYLMRVRGWIAKRALSDRVANLSQIARALGRDRATLRYAMRRYPNETE